MIFQSNLNSSQNKLYENYWRKTRALLMWRANIRISWSLNSAAFQSLLFSHSLLLHSLADVYHVYYIYI